MAYGISVEEIRWDTATIIPMILVCILKLVYT